MLSSLLVLLAVSVSLIFYLLKPDKKFECLKPYTATPAYVPLLGHSYTLITNNIFKAIEIITSKNKPCVMWEGPKPLYATNDAEELKIILNHPNALNKLTKFRFLEEVFQGSIIGIEASIWRKNRKKLSKAFHQNILDSFVYIFYERSLILVDILKNVTSTTDFYDLFQKFTMDSFLVANTGVDKQVQRENYIEIVDYLLRGQAIAIDRFFKPHFWNDTVFKYFGRSSELTKCVKETTDYLSEVLNQRQHLKDNGDFNETRMKPIMDLLLEMNELEDIDKSYVINEVRTFFYAATDTSAHTVAFTCTLLGMHPEIQEKVYEEVINVVGKDSPITSKDLPNLKYTEMVVNESLRLFPVVPFVGRFTTGEIDIGRLVLPKGIEIGVLIFQLHRNEKYFPDPSKFDPDRFLPEEVAKRHPYSFLPFSGGPRNCIGWKYAMMMLKTSMATIVRNYKMHSNYKSTEEMELESHIILRTSHNLDLTFTPRY
ncbi:unnamed protein product [Brassicogethes aeneus]|uniref:Cytochrome P450 n=1 Tax=Brassicogethes aeneus TaxID=1431903 RepID=A0A9P0FLJ1_BRAAE|nr:unnamed protein product [Brassicogethes aeneus]